MLLCVTMAKHVSFSLITDKISDFSWLSLTFSISQFPTSQVRGNHFVSFVLTSAIWQHIAEMIGSMVMLAGDEARTRPATTACGADNHDRQN